MTRETYIRGGIVIGALFLIGVSVSQGWLTDEWGGRVEGALAMVGLGGAVAPRETLTNLPKPKVKKES